MKILRLISFIAFLILSASIILNGQTLKMNKAKTEIAELLKMKATIFKRPENSPDKNTYEYWGTQKNVPAFEDRIEFKLKKKIIIIHYSDIAEYEIQYTTNDKNNSGVYLEDFLIMLDGYVDGKKLADDFIYIQNRLRDSDKNYNQQLTLFEPIAMNYRELKVKPAVSEDQRRFIVLGNSNFQEKLYDKAIANFIKAIEVDQTAYPAAYSNLALLSAQLKNYHAAVYYMKKYLLLAPDASDARSAQDKIYEWEDKISNN